MGNSIYLGGGIKSAFCGGNVKEIWQGSNKVFGGGGGDPMPEGFVKASSIEMISNSDCNLIRDTSYFVGSFRGNSLIEIEGVFCCNGSYNGEYLYVLDFTTNNTLCFFDIGNSTYYKKMITTYRSSNGGSVVKFETNFENTPIAFKITKEEDSYIRIYCNGSIYKSDMIGYTSTSNDGNYISTIFRNIKGHYKGSKLSSIKFTDRDSGQVTLNIVPAKRISDNAPAIIDLVSQTIIIANQNHFVANA